MMSSIVNPLNGKSLNSDEIELMDACQNLGSFAKKTNETNNTTNNKNTNNNNNNKNNKTVKKADLVGN